MHVLLVAAAEHGLEIEGADVEGLNDYDFHGAARLDRSDRRQCGEGHGRACSEDLEGVAAALEGDDIAALAERVAAWDEPAAPGPGQASDEGL
ncbi:unnamed protein product, partial [Prorocentrum cordatum]